MTALASPIDAAPAENLDRALGLVRRISSDPEGRALLEYEAGPHMCHSGGVVQGGFISGWLDAAMAHAVIARSGMDMTPMSLELKVSFFAPTRPGRVFAEAWIEKAGRATCFTEAKLTDAEGVVLAKASSTLRLIPRAKVEADARAALAPVSNPGTGAARSS
jgi:acyl-coenzyme A thioesterase PaaI-like protein